MTRTRGRLGSLLGGRRAAVTAAVGLLVLLPAPTLRAQPACAPTPPDAEGPFYRPGAPTRDRTGQGLVLSGTVRSGTACGPLGGARLEWWSADPGGRYDDAHRAAQATDGSGRYRYETDVPGRYPGRPPHLHVRVTAPGHRPLVTQIYPAGGQTSLAVDFVLIRD